MKAGLRDSIGRALGSAVVRASGVAGGDINEAYRVELADGRVVFAKANAAAPADMFPAEARGLAWLAEAHALRVPTVLAASPPFEPERWLALEYVEPGGAGARLDERLGQGLAALHRAGAPSFGLPSDNYIGRLPQSNAARASWPAFYAEQRLAPMIRRAADHGAGGPRLVRAVERVISRVDDLAGPPEPPSRLHGDLWGGNLLVDASGEPCLVDPAVYGGHREVDLAMMRLFGGFGERCFRAYAESHPLSPGHEDRVPLYQLYPLLVHVNLFGGSYEAAAVRAAERCA